MTPKSFVFLWIGCFICTLYFLFHISDEDRKYHEKEIMYLSKSKTKHEMIQKRKNIRKEFYSDDLSGTITAKDSTWIYDPKKNIFEEKFSGFNGSIKQNNAVKTLNAKSGTFDYHSLDLTLLECKTSIPYESALISSFSKEAAFHLDPKCLSFSLDDTHAHIEK